MGVQLSKWGNSLGVRLPKLVVEQAQLRVGDQVEVSVAETGQVLLTPVHRKLTVENLVDGITPQNRHSETEWGEARGGYDLRLMFYIGVGIADPYWLILSQNCCQRS